MKKNKGLNIENSLKESFLKTNSDLNVSGIDTYFSGSTVVSILFNEKTIYSSNVGDSRAIIASCDGANWTAKPLTRDHKPDNPEEMKRILDKGGRVEAFKGETL